MKRWKKWEMALLLALCGTMIWGAWAVQRQDALARKMIRMHVIANSDSDADQTLKLQVRDKVLDYTTAILQRANDMEDAQTQLRDALGRIENIAQREIVNRGYDYPVTAQLASTEFPLKEYDGFSLPAGEYMALRVLIGEAEGQNWWCVVYPPLCMTAASDVAQTGIACGMEQEDMSLMQEEDEGYQIKFRCVELWEQLRQWLHK